VQVEEQLHVLMPLLGRQQQDRELIHLTQHVDGNGNQQEHDHRHRGALVHTLEQAAERQRIEEAGDHHDQAADHAEAELPLGPDEVLCRCDGIAAHEKPRSGEIREAAARQHDDGDETGEPS
jgi:hypothetical protein